MTPEIAVCIAVFLMPFVLYITYDGIKDSYSCFKQQEKRQLYFMNNLLKELQESNKDLEKINSYINNFLKEKKEIESE